MAAKRVSKTTLNWAAFADKIKPQQRDVFRMFKAKHDLFMKEGGVFTPGMVFADTTMLKRLNAHNVLFQEVKSDA